MISLNALDRGTGARRWLLDRGAEAMHLVSLATDLALVPLMRLPAWSRAPGVAVRAGVPVAEFAGDPAAVGAAAGVACARAVRRLLPAMRAHPAVALGRGGATFAGALAAIPAEHRVELDAFAVAAGVDRDDLYAANVVVDWCCSALVRTRPPLAVARNMDFFPSAPLAHTTLVSIVRGRDAIAFANVGWPGCAGVVSGLNARGLSACILLNYAARTPRPTLPMAFAVRRLLERCATVDEACALFARLAPGSDHYVLVADARGAAITWFDGVSAHRHDAADGWLSCSNGRRDPATRRAADDRGRALQALADDARDADEAWLRRALGASYLRGINTQAMLLVPAERRLQLAVGSAGHPAALAAWSELDLGPALDGAPAAAIAARPLGRPRRVAHYRAA